MQAKLNFILCESQYGCHRFFCDIQILIYLGSIAACSMHIHSIFLNCSTCCTFSIWNCTLIRWGTDACFFHLHRSFPISSSVIDLLECRRALNGKLYRTLDIGAHCVMRPDEERDIHYMLNSCCCCC